MPIRELPDGSYEIDYGDGAPYNVPKYIARRDFPEQFPDMYADPSDVPPEAWGSGPGMSQAQPEPEPEMEAPPWLGDPYDTSAADAIAQEQFEAAQEPVETFAFPEEAEPSRGRSRGMSASASWTGPYQESGPVERGAMPDYRQEQAMSDAAYRKKIAAIDATQSGMAQSLANQEGLIGQQAEHRQQTVAEQQRMHEESMAEVQRREQELEQAMSQISRMDMRKIWKDSDATVHAAGYLAAGIAGFLNPTGKNSVIEQMQALADRSAREQAANIKLEQDRVRGMGQALGRYEARAGRDEELYLTQRALLEKSIVDQIGMEKQKYQSIITLGNLEQMEAAALDQLAKTTGERRQKIYENHRNERQFRAEIEERKANRRMQAAARRASLAMREKELDARMAKGQEEVQRPYVKDPQTGAKVFVDPMVWGQKDKGAQQDWKDQIRANHDVAEAIKNLHDTVNRYGEVYGGPGKKWKMSPTSEAYIEIDKARQKVMEQIAFAKGGKQLSLHELKVFESQMGPMETWLQGGDNAKRHRSMMKALESSNARLYREVGATTPQEVEIQPERDVSPEWQPGDLSPATIAPPVFGVEDAEYLGPTGQFDLAEPGDREKLDLQHDIDLLGAAVDDVVNARGEEAMDSLSGAVSDAYGDVLSKYEEGEYSASGADETAKKIKAIVGRLPSHLRPQQPFFGGERDVESDFKSYSAESEGVRAALEAISKSDELSHKVVTPGSAMRKDPPYTLEQFNKAREKMGLNPTMKVGF